MFRKLIALNEIALSNILIASEKEIEDVDNRFECLHNKRIQKRYLGVSLYKNEDLKILSLFLTKIKLNIEEIYIGGDIIMKKEDFELIRP
jgi:hypothetical protein